MEGVSIVLQGCAGAVYYIQIRCAGSFYNTPEQTPNAEKFSLRELNGKMASDFSTF